MIRLIAVGKLKDRRLTELVADYEQRICSMAPFASVEVRDSDPEREAREMIRKLGSPEGNEYVVALDEGGRSAKSTDLATLLGQHGSIAFLVGGAEGLGPAVRERADHTLRLSSLTLTHEMARLLLAEQIYRGLSILRHKPYHRA